MCVFVTTTNTQRPGIPQQIGLKDQTLGVEIETIGRTRPQVAKAIQSVTGGRVRVGRDCYDSRYVTAPDGREWRVMSDSSLSAPRRLQAEIVSPILRYEDIPQLQEIVRAVRRCGAKVDASCGIHIHVGARSFPVKGLVNLVKLVNKQQPLIENAIGIHARRAEYCRGICPQFLSRIERERPTTLDELNAAWYGRRNRRPTHYDRSRYRGLNLHNVWYRGTVEFRWFNATLHAGKVKAYIQFCLALSAKAINARSSSSKRREFNPATSKYDFRCFLLRLGLIGDEFKTCRLHMMARLNGSAAWRGERRDRNRSPRLQEVN